MTRRLLQALSTGTTRRAASLLVVCALVPVSAHAGVTLLSRTPIWSSAPAASTLDIAIGDVNRDGSLDLVCANDGEAPTLYASHRGTLPALPSWVRPGGPRAQTVALGDVDGDGRLDVVFGGPAGTTLHRNNGIYFSDEAELISNGTSFVAAVSLGDVDGDGDLDVLCGSTAGRFGLYRNVDGTFERVPSWEAGHTTAAIVLGDVDADGDLDLVCTTDDHVRLYRNIGGTFEVTPAWESARISHTSSLALGDLDGDGDLDLACGNLSEPSEVFANDGGTFGVDPVWTADVRAETRSVAIADADGDGFLDLACGVQDGPSLVYRGVAGGLETSPTWRSDTSDATTSVAWADLDGDGDAELVCGNFLQTATAFDNLRPPFEQVTAWTGATPAKDVALGDVDGDGDQDAVFGGDTDALYRNDAGSLERDPIWTPAAPRPTSGVALGDVDGDGDLDLVCGRHDDPNALFRNIGGTFETAPSWSAERPESTTAVALADLDLDGDLDLVCATSGRAHAYRNTGGTFATTPFWTSGETTDGLGLAVGLVDGNEYPDIVVGSILYLNRPTGLDTVKSWQATALGSPTDVALGDVDGDGRSDLVLANGDRGNALYLNDSFVFGPRTVWYPESPDGSQGIALGDIDGDGDLDVIAAGSGVLGRDVVYQNLAGHLAATPLWATPIRATSAAVALGDLDGDGDLDAVFAEAPAVFAYEGIQRPPQRFDPVTPAGQVTNNAAYLRDLRLIPEGANLRHVQFRAIDVESDALWIVPQYQRLGAGEWSLLRRPPPASPREMILGPFDASPAGVPQEFDWDLAGLDIGPQPVAMRLLVISYPRQVGPMQYVSAYYADAGEINVRRPILEGPVENIELPVVTVGDTVFVEFPLVNKGNETARVDSIQVVSLPGAVLDAQPPFTIAPAESLQVRLIYKPVVIPAASSRLDVYSNDPVAPIVPVGLVPQTLGLAVRTQALAQVDSVPLGQALTIQVIPEAGVHLERATLFYKPPGIGIFSQLDMQRAAGDFRPDGPRFGIVPGDEVTEIGLEYFVEVENSGVVVHDPPTAPADSVFHQAVARPAGIHAVPQPNSTSGFLAGRSITVQVGVPTGSQFTRGALHYRRGGTVEFAVDSLRAGEPLPIGTIPDSVVGPRGLEYYVELQTRTGTLTDPGHDPKTRPATLRVRVQNMTEGQHPGMRYRLLSVPLDFGDFAGTLADLVADEPEFGPYDPTRWRAFLYGEGRGNVELSDARPGAFRPTPGRAFWLITREPHQIDTAPIEGLSTPTGVPFRIVLSPGWNPVGDPFAFPVAWHDVRSSVPFDPPVAFDPALGTQGDYAELTPELLRPFDGYFVDNPSARAETLYVPPIEAGASVPVNLTRAATPASPTPDAWRLRLVARGGAGLDAANVLGVDARAADAHDALDAREPPAIPGAVQLYFANADWRERPGAYRRDLRAANGTGHAWDVEVRGGVETEIALEPQCDAPLPAGLALVLLDLEQGSRVDLRGADGALVAHRILGLGAERPYRLRVLAGTPEWVEREAASTTALPVAFTVQQNAPNPFNGGTRFRFGLPQPARVTLEIFDVQGRSVAVLAQREPLPAGWHTRLWDGTTRGTAPAASGVYFFRLRAGDQVVTKRMVLVK